MFFICLNQMDQESADGSGPLLDLKKNLDGACVAFDMDHGSDEFLEELATCDEIALEEYSQDGQIGEKRVIQMIADRKVYPCYFGSALKVQGVQEFLEGFEKYTVVSDGTQKFGAKVFKITRDNQGNRLTHLRVTGGTLKVKEILSGTANDGKAWEEKVNQIRIYSGDKYETVQEASAGMICAVTGLSSTYPGEGLGEGSEIYNAGTGACHQLSGRDTRRLRCS